VSDSDSDSDTVSAVRQAMGPIGAFLPYPTSAAPDIGDQIAAVRRLERVGYGAVWVNEVPGKDALVQLSILLAGTDRIVLGTGVVNVWSRSPHTAHGAATLLAQAFPDRFVLGIGSGHPGQAETVGREFGRPLATMRDYLGQMTAITPGSATATPYPRLIGANGPTGRRAPTTSSHCSRWAPNWPLAWTDWKDSRRRCAKRRPRAGSESCSDRDAR